MTAISLVVDDKPERLARCNLLGAVPSEIRHPASMFTENTGGSK